uniref:Calicivirus coat protein domain-containing protein n=1 Tax=Guangdong greater green snake calicivirus TaxID=2116169 RepID=A0A2P1GML2_9CALI|nr:hypothetical protein [Guangdong greater green snake calicivirus]
MDNAKQGDARGPKGQGQQQQQPITAVPAGMVASDDAAGAVLPTSALPTAPEQAVNEFTGGLNAIDPEVYCRFVQAPSSTFVVQSNQGEGTLLWQSSVGPELNPFLSHLARMYNSWAGDMEVQIVIAASAFLAGKLVVAMLPPGIQPQGVTPNTVTGYPHAIIDIRNPDPVTMLLPDIRNKLYHMQGQPDVTSTLAVFVFTPLRAPGDEAFGVIGRVLSRPTPGFNFAFLTPPRLPNLTTGADFSMLSQPMLSLDQSSAWAEYVGNVQIGPARVQRLPRHYGGVTSSGELWGWYTGQPSSTCYIQAAGNGGNFSGVFCNPDGEPWTPGISGGPVPPQVPKFGATFDVSARGIDSTGALWNLSRQLALTVGANGLTVSGTYSGSEWTTSLMAVTSWYPRTGFSPWTAAQQTFNEGDVPADYFTIPVPGESFVSFGPVTHSTAGDTDLFSPQTAQMAIKLASGSFEIPQGSVVLFNLVDRTDRQVIAECKLWPAGFITAASHGEETVTNLGANLDLVYISTVPQRYTFNGAANARRRRQNFV